jgi:predicted ferric reductase
MAAMTIGQLLVMPHQACHRSYLVDYVIVQAIDADTLNVRIHLTRAGAFAFIKAFYNVTTELT